MKAKSIGEIQTALVEYKDDSFYLIPRNATKQYKSDKSKLTFSTKPTVKGPGLGLSLAYDIITKGHGGHLEVETKKGEGSRFVVRLPVV